MMTSTIQDLSPELMVKVFSHYIESEGHMAFSKNVMLVCKAWRNLSSVSSLWTNMNEGSWRYVVSMSHSRLLYHTKSLQIPSRNPSFRVWRNPRTLLVLLGGIHDLRTLKITKNSVNVITMAIVVDKCPNLENLFFEQVSRGEYQTTHGRQYQTLKIPIRLEELKRILNKCGQNLKRLNFTRCRVMDSERLVAEIAAKCPSLEVLEWCNENTKFPISEFEMGCPRLRKLVLGECEIVTAGENGDFGLRDLIAFEASRCDFHGLDVCSLLKNSEKLERLDLDWNSDLVFSGVSKIPSDKVRFLSIRLKDRDMSLTVLKEAVGKWKDTLVHLRILLNLRRSDVTSVLSILIDSDVCPILEVLEIRKDSVDLSFFKTFILKCENVKKIVIQGKKSEALKYYENRKEVLKFCETL